MCKKYARLEEGRPGAALGSGHDVHAIHAVTLSHRLTPPLLSRDEPAGPCTFRKGRGCEALLAQPYQVLFYLRL